ncbi:MAG: pyridoxamine 5'-phosphate oxidase family protein [Thermoplasmata archaeon]|nr:MAG: pyridoxamine 5'-phosphate oxidase family protein [Thermoplasmata archaeon]
MRRSEKEITEKTEIESIIQQSMVCRLALSDGQYPYIVPLCFGYSNHTLYFHSAKEGKKLDILKRNNQVCFEFDIETEVKLGKTACDWGMAYQSVIGFGKALMVEDVAEKRKALELITAQYADKAYKITDGAAKETQVFKVEISTMTGKRSG